jgi:hypothetical protein
MIDYTCDCDRHYTAVAQIVKTGGHAVSHLGHLTFTCTCGKKVEEEALWRTTHAARLTPYWHL